MNDIISVSNDTLFVYEVKNMDQKAYEILKNTFLFKGTDDKTLIKCCENGGFKTVTYSPSDIMQSANTEKSIAIIIKGKAFITSGDDGVVIRKLFPGDIYGAAILFDSPVYLTKVIALSECTVLTVDKQFVENAISLDKRVAFNYIEFLSSKIGFLNSKISSYTAKNAESKLMAYLLQLPRENGAVTLKTDYSAIAKAIGIGRASLYRSFEKLEADGLIIKNGKNIIIKEV